MQVRLLGTGAALPSPRRVQSGILVTAGADPVLVDCGSGVVHRMAGAGRSVQDVSTVLLTHHHLDHVADLPTLVKARVLQGWKDIRIVGPPGTRALVDRLLESDGLRDRADLVLEEYAHGTDRIELEEMVFEPHPTQHTSESHAYRIDDRLVISGDTAPDEAIFGLADGVHTLIHECAYPDAVEDPDHTTPHGLLGGIDAITVEQVVLTHLFPVAERAVDAIRATMREGTDVSVLVGEDGMQLAIPD